MEWDGVDRMGWEGDRVGWEGEGLERGDMGRGLEWNGRNGRKRRNGVRGNSVGVEG